MLARVRLVILAFSLATPLSSQVVGASISGVISDPNGAPLPSAQVVLTNSETNGKRSLVTDANGHYMAPSIAVGSYQISASKEGFESEVRTGIPLVVGQSQEVDLTLQVGEIRQVVTVEEAPDPLAVSTEDTSGLVNERQVKELPLNGRSYDQLLTLNPATVNYTSQRSGGVGTSNSSVGNMFAVSGHRPQENLFLLNGIEYTGASEINNTPGGASGELLGVDAVREFNVVTDS
ncbi:MAG TPA: carboxypeptidase-like regulatory domain-containing protein, partial [Bryobacteraceae bacterium]|nr:carboxypeptidase-like regulatory domain-containing protein [Bryobacteraceae bacterium]